MATQVTRRLKAICARFFSDLETDDRTGQARGARKLGPRFSTWPRLGSRYAQDGHPRILFVGMRLGHDQGYPESLEQAQEWVERTAPLPRYRGKRRPRDLVRASC